MLKKLLESLSLHGGYAACLIMLSWTHRTHGLPTWIVLVVVFMVIMVMLVDTDHP